MNKRLLAFFAAILIYSAAQAAIRRVGYWGTAIANVDYATPDLELTASFKGDVGYGANNKILNPFFGKNLLRIRQHFKNGRR